MGHKVRVFQHFLSKYQMSTSCVSVVEVRNVHGERLDRESTVTELIDNLRNAPPFANQEGTAYLFAFLRFPTNISSRTRALVRQGYALSIRVERLDQRFSCSAQRGYTTGDRGHSPGNSGNPDELLGNF
jgi:hypothetical protein